MQQAERSWHRLQSVAAEYGATWLVLGTNRTKVIAAALREVGDLGVEGLVLAIRGYAHKTREWSRSAEYFKPEVIFRPSHLAANVDAGYHARKEAEAEQAQASAANRVPSAALWD